MRFLIALIGLLVCLAGCSKGPDLVGTWQSGLGGALTTYHFKQDGTYMLECLYDGMHIVSNGKYRMEGQQLILEPASAEVQGANPRVEEYRSKMMQGSRVTVKMNGPDNFQLGLDMPPLMVHRMSKQP
jgi:hypothetical protein